MAKSIILFCEDSADGGIEKSSLEVIGLGQELSGPLGLDLKVVTYANIAEKVSSHTPSQVYSIEKPEGPSFSELITAALINLCEEADADTVLFAHTPLGQDIAPRLSHNLNSWCVTDAIALKVDQNKLIVEKPVQGGAANASYSFNTSPVVVTIRRGVGSAPEKDDSNRREIIEFATPEISVRNKWEVVEQIKEESAQIKLEEAEIVVSGGRGMGGPEGFEIIKELASELGAAVGSSRPPCDAGWVPSSHQVGITGKVISPPVYIAVGISGAAQHLSGMGDSKKIIAINKDEEAEIFKVADYGAVGDYKEIIPAFLEVIKGKKG
jgi:electron transfer flavoprotein alpha subunit